MGQVATKLLSLIMLLQSRKSWKVAELAQELNVSGRTVHRYMGMLDEMGIPLCSERGPNGGFSLVRGYRLPPLLFSAEEATVLYMGAHLVRQLFGETYHDAVTGATAKLDNVLPDTLREQVARSEQSLVVGGLTALDYRPFDPTIHRLRQCIEERRRVQLRYRGLRGQETERCVDPYAMALQWGWWYLVGFCHLRGSLRTFRVDRIQQVLPLTEAFVAPESFSVREYLERAMQYEPRYQVEVRLQGTALAKTAQRHDAWMQIEEQADGGAVVRFGTDDLQWAASWVLACGAEARVVRPPELLGATVLAAQAILAVYQDAESRSRGSDSLTAEAGH